MTDGDGSIRNLHCVHRTRAHFAAQLLLVLAALAHAVLAWPAPANAELDQPTPPDFARPVCQPGNSGWSHLDGATAHVRIWWPLSGTAEDQARLHSLAELYRSELDNVIWPKLTALMGRSPLPDAGEVGSPECNGGDGRLDIYVSSQYRNAKTLPDGECSAISAYMLVSPGSDRIPPTGKATIAHEFMHVLQFSYKLAGDGCQFKSEYRWWSEATAEWTRDYVYNQPPGNEGGEHVSAPYFLNETELPLSIESFFHCPIEQRDCRAYGAYLFPFFIAHDYGAERIRLAWEGMEQRPALEAIDSVLPGGFKEAWPAFVLKNWNRDPITDYSEWDELDVSARALPIAVELGETGSVEYPLQTGIKALAAKYFHFTFSDSTVRSISFRNEVLGQRTARVQALVKVAGAWVVEDWTTVNYRAFCRDVRSERLEELVLIISNSEWQDPGHALTTSDLPWLVATNIGCWHWSGTVTATVTKEALGAYRQEETVVAKATWQRIRTFGPITVPHLEFGKELFEVVVGTAEWRHTGALGTSTDPVCSGFGLGSYALRSPLGPSVSGLEIWAFESSGTYGRGYRANGVTPPDVPGAFYTIPYQCRDATVQVGGLTLMWWSMGASDSAPLAVMSRALESRAATPSHPSMAARGGNGACNPRRSSEPTLRRRLASRARRVTVS